MPSKKKTDDTVAVPENPNRDQENKAKAELALDAAIAKYNDALAAENVDLMREAEAEIEKAEGEYAEAAQCEVFALCKEQEHPMPTQPSAL